MIPAAARTRRAQGGFTLVELMVVVAIIAVLIAVVLVYIRPQSKTIDVANRVGDVSHEASRNAIALGPVRADVVQALLAAGNSPTVARARTRIVGGGAANSSPTFTIQRAVEAALPATTVSWVNVSTYTTDPVVIGVAWAPGTGSNAALTAVLQTSWSGLTIYCDPDGTCQPFTLFFQNTRNTSGPNFQARLSILPLGGAILTRPDWN